MEEHVFINKYKDPFLFPDFYKYVVKLEKELSSEENLYRKAELKYLLVKQVERAMKEVAIDCPVNYNGNVFIKEVDDNRGCYKPKIGVELPTNTKFCSEKCDFLECDYLCVDKKLNLDFYDKKSRLYKKIIKDNLDYTTFTDELAKNEINNTKEKIKELFRLKYVYTLREILKEVKNMYKEEQQELFEDWFVYQALDKLIPVDKNEFINFKDTIYDKFNIAGYLIYRGYFYIFQPFEQDEDAPMFYRKTYTKDLINQLSLYSYLQGNKLYNESIKVQDDIKASLSLGKYDFKTNQEYYDEREEFDIVGIIDMLTGTRKLTIGKEGDVFKIRDKRNKQVDKKRGTGIPSITGAVCYSSKDKKELKKLANKINIDYNKKDTRIDTCTKIRDRLLFLEKFSTGKDNMTYMMIPYNHPKYTFPLNLENIMNCGWKI